MLGSHDPSPPEFREGVQPLSPEGSGPSFDFDAPMRAFGSFQVEAALGAGRFGPVFLAHNKITAQRVVIRTFESAPAPDQRQRFVETLKGLCELPLEHAGVARPITAGLEADIPYLVHAYLDGVPADEFLTTRGPQRLAELAPHVNQAAAAIDFCTTLGVHHGALSLRDIIIGRDGTGISGFGLLQSLGYAVEQADDVQALAGLALRLLDPADHPMVRELVEHPPATALEFAAAFQAGGGSALALAGDVNITEAIRSDEEATLDLGRLHLDTLDNFYVNEADAVPLHGPANSEPVSEAPIEESIVTRPVVDFNRVQRDAPAPEITFGAILDERPEAAAPTSSAGRWLALVAGVAIAAGAVFGLGYFAGRRDIPRPPAAVAPQPQPQPTATGGRAYTEEPAASAQAAPKTPPPVKNQPAVTNQSPVTNQPPPKEQATAKNEPVVKSPPAVKSQPAAKSPPAASQAVKAAPPPPAARPVEKPRPAKAEPRTPAASSEAAILFVDSLPAGAEVMLDGASVGHTPLLLNDVRPGDHRVQLSMPMRRVWQTTVTAPAGVRTRVAGRLEDAQQ
jgi:hypothetical protein